MNMPGPKSSKLTLKAEYLYVGSGRSSAVSTFIDPASNAWNITHHERKNLSIVRIGLNYLFNCTSSNSASQALV